MSSSLDKLVGDIIADSKTKAEALKKQAVAEIEQMLAAEKAQAVREAEQIIRNAKSDADAERNRRISQAKQRTRLVYLAEKNKIVHGVMEDLQSMLAQFARADSSYRPFLLRAIAQGVESVPSGSLQVFLSERDLKRYGGSKLIEQALGMTQASKRAVLSEEPIAAIGGAVVTSEDGKIRADCTVDARLELMKPHLVAEISKILFGL